MRLLKLVCSVASAELADVLADELVLEVDPVLVAAAVLEDAAVLEVEQVLEPALEIADDALLCKPELAVCACRAAIRLCMNCSTASAAVLASVLADDDDADAVDAEVPEVVLSVVESVPVVELVLPTPLACNASMIALIKPPPGGGGGGEALALEVASVPLVDVD